MLSRYTLGKYMNVKTSLKSLVVAYLVLFGAGCTNKDHVPNVIVASQQLNGYTGKVYTGAALVDNPVHIKKAVATLPSVVHFDFDSDELTLKTIQILDKQADFLITHSTTRVLIAGHTDERGSREYNISLGERRAVVVKDYLLSKGVHRTNIEIASFGEEQPIDPTSNEAAWAKNRRVELVY